MGPSGPSFADRRIGAALVAACALALASARAGTEATHDAQAPRAFEATSVSSDLPDERPSRDPATDRLAPDGATAPLPNDAPSVARAWTEALLFAARHDFARPPVHARNLYHLAAAMYDAWAVHDMRARPLFLGVDDHPACDADDTELEAWRDDGRDGDDPIAAREGAVAQAAWHFLRHRYRNAADAAAIRGHVDALADDMALRGIPDATDPAANLGLRVAECVIGAGRRDDANEDADYRNLTYTPVNPPLSLVRGGNPGLVAPSRWQPLAIPDFLDQAGRPATPGEFLGADWGAVRPFAMDGDDATVVVRGNLPRTVYHDPGPPPTLEADPGAYLAHFALVARWSSHLDPASPATIDVRPRGRAGGLGPDDLETDPIAQLAHYDPDGGPTTPIDSVLADDEAFEPSVVPLGDYARAIAEYWADGVDSETPPGHWLALYNEHVSAHPALARRLGGVGETLDPLAFDVIAYLALGGALHDAAVAAWSIKGAYDYVRPISAIRYLGETGAPPTDASGDGREIALPVVPDLAERVEIGDPLAGPGGVNVGQIKIRAWRGPDAIDDPVVDTAGVGWILARDWWPYQRPSFVTPPFAGYVSGHSTFSRAAAVVLERLTGSPRWPGGSAGFTAKADEFLVFEAGPSVDVPLVWATYRDAADQSALSRIWGGIHPPADDLPGRRVGAAVGEAAWRRALELAGRTPDSVAGNAPDATAPPGDAPPSTGVLHGCSVAGSGDRDVLVVLAVLGAALRRSARRFRGPPPGPVRDARAAGPAAPGSRRDLRAAPSPRIPPRAPGPRGRRGSAAPP